MNAGTDHLVVLAPGIRRLRAANPSPMTGTGTNTYLLQTAAGTVVIDPGPLLADHLAAVLAALQPGLPVAAILISHPHLDHSALARPLTDATGAKVMAFGTATSGRSPLMQRLAAQGLTGGGEGVDTGFAPDIRLIDGQRLTFGAYSIEVLHCPGHFGGHLCFALDDVLFSADHVMGWATSLISPPDGDMGAYMASLGHLASRHWSRFLPGHGEPVEAPAARLADLIAHRLARESAILAALHAGDHTAQRIAHRIYLDTPAALMPAAARSVLAHLIDLWDRNLVSATQTPGPQTPFLPT